MTSNGAPAGSAEPAEIDTSVAHAARVYDYLLGGRANFKVDREAAELVYAAWPGGIDAVRADVQQSRAALGRVVGYFVRDAGITQFLDIGTGIPKENNVHEVAQAEAPDARIVYVDRDPIVLAHAHQLLRGTRPGSVSYIYGDLHDPQPILAEAAKTLDFSRPTAVMLFGILHFFSDADDPRGVIGRLLEPLAEGSGLAISHLAGDLHSEEMSETFKRVNSRMAETVTLRSHDEVAALLTGLDPVEPGVVQASQWRPDPGTTPASSQVWLGVGRKAV
ncbi:MAG TPA: SAM-dependent methyltransferase [Streptosporangiaceae bacterium]|nr:SAM-dependent methyltransferase [Streptosporangiaceae bacterium]